MSWTRRIALAVVLVAAGLALYLGRSSPPPPSQAPPMPAASPAGPAQPSDLPRLLDLGAGKCVPCKAMAPILEDLRRDFAGRMDVQFIDVWENPEAARAHQIGLIPTQIFYDGQGRELFRHEGFFSREEILDTWTRLGYPLATVNTP